MSQAQWEEVESKLWSNGVIKGGRNEFVTTTTTGLGISVNTGDAMLDGFRFYSDAATPLTAAAADPSLPRIDLLVLRIDEAAHTATIALKTGTPAGSPVAPSATQTPGGTYELGIYQVRVNAASTSITSLTDVRAYTAPSSSVNKTGDTMTGALEIDQTLGGSNKVVQRWVATDGKTYALVLTTTNGLRISNITDNFIIAEFGPAAGAVTANGQTIWNAGNDGTGSGLDADLLDGLNSGNASGNVPISNGTLNTNLNADKVDGLDATGFLQVGTGNQAATPVKFVIVGPTSAALPAAGTKGRLGFVVPFTLP